MNIHFIQRKLLMSYNIKSRIWKKQCSTKWMQYYIQILNLLTKVLLSHLKKKPQNILKSVFPWLTKNQIPNWTYSVLLNSSLQVLCGLKWCRERRAVNNRKSSETELLCMLFICHSTYILCTLFSSPVHLLHFLRCGCWTSKWIEKCRNRSSSWSLSPADQKANAIRSNLSLKLNLLNSRVYFVSVSALP